MYKHLLVIFLAIFAILACESKKDNEEPKLDFSETEVVDYSVTGEQEATQNNGEEANPELNLENANQQEETKQSEKPIEKPKQEVATTKSSANEYVKVVYFHGDRRCPTCIKIQQFSEEAVKNKFDAQIADGKVKWEIINISKKENEHYVNDFQLFSQSLIMMKYSGGKIKEWKNCQKVWELTHNKDSFIEYVSNEVKAYLGE